MESAEDSESDDNAPTVMVNGKAVPLTSIDDDVIAQMTPTEKETYIQVYQEYYSHMYDWSNKYVLDCKFYLSE